MSSEGAARLWKYTDDAYDRYVSEVINGAAELSGIRTADTMGHLRVSSVGVLYRAFVKWAKAMRSKL